MIVMVRLDERMIHGQVAIKWSRHTGVDRIVVANDEAAANPLIQKSLMMAAPQTAKTAIKSVTGAIELLKDPKAAQHKIMIIVSTTEDLLRIATEVPDIPLINVGNYGRVASKVDAEPRKPYRKNLYAYDEEVSVLKKVMETGIKCNYQTVPDDVPEALEKVLN
ncbi:MAG: PTS sugar transporter subunit IIB [Lacrimispora sp.]